jgi:hypothetical protein
LSDSLPIHAVHQHAHHAQNIHNQALDEQVIILEDAVWNEDAYENNEPAAQPEELPGMGGGMDFQQQNAVFPQPPLIGDDMVDARLRGSHRQALQGEARWFRENANELPCPGARYTVLQTIMSALSILVDKSVHQVVFDLFMTLVSEALPEGNHWPRCELKCIAPMACDTGLAELHVHTNKHTSRRTSQHFLSLALAHL